MLRSTARLLLVLLACTAACEQGGGPVAPGASASIPAWASFPGPVVRIEKSQVLVDGKLAGSTYAIEELGRLQKLDEQFELLQKKRKLYEQQHPATPFGGKALLLSHPQARLLVVKSVFQTAAYAGYPDISMELDGKRVALRAQLILPSGDKPPEQVPMYDWRGEPAQAPGREYDGVLHVHVTEGELKLTWVLRGEVIARRAAPLPPEEGRVAALTKLFEEEWQQRGSHHAAPDRERDQAIVHGDNHLPLEDLFVVFEALLAHKRSVDGQDGAPRELPIFQVTFSVR